MPKPDAPSLNRADYEVRTIPLDQARDLVERYHYSGGGSNTAVFRHGLFRKGEDRPLGVAWWIPPTRTAAESVDRENWRGVLTLTRLVVVPEVPQNGASFLLAASVKLIRQDPRWVTLVTWADEGQGHTGAIYRAANWTYVSTSKGDPVYVDSTGRQVARKAGPKTRTNQEMLDLGYVNKGRTRKHKFVLSLRKGL